MKRTRLPLITTSFLFTVAACTPYERPTEEMEKYLFEIDPEIEQGSVVRSSPPPCDIEVQPLLATVVGDSVEVHYDDTALYTSEVYVAGFSGWSTADYFFNEIHPNESPIVIPLPSGLPPSNPLEYWVYLESAENGVRTTECWDYAPLTVESAASLGEIWGTASAHTADVSLFPLAPQGTRPGGLVWRLDLDTMQTEIIVEFDPAGPDNI